MSRPVERSVDEGRLEDAEDLRVALERLDHPTEERVRLEDLIRERYFA